ncbi:putative symporter YidK [compost metagenome]
MLSNEKRTTIDRLTKAIDLDDQSTIDETRAALKHSNEQLDDIRTEVIGLIKKNNPSAETNDNNYIFLSFVNNTFPKGLIGLLIAVIFLASMGSTASAINSLASTSTVDIYKRFINKQSTTEQDLFWSRMFTLFWGIFSIAVALYASKLGNLLEAVNILGSLFYGTILGIFIVAFYMKKIGGKAVFYAAILSEVIIFIIWKMDVIAFLWLNVIGCLAVMILAYLMKKLDRKKSHSVE